MTSPQVCPVARRALLRGAGAAGMVALLAGCGGDAPPVAATSPTPTTSAAPEVPPGPEMPQGALVNVDEVPVNGGVLVDDVLVVQPKKGTFRAFDAVCPHQRIMVNPPDSSGLIKCPGHLSHFRASDGSRVDGPAPRGLRAIEIKVVDGYVTQS